MAGELGTAAAAGRTTAGAFGASVHATVGRGDARGGRAFMGDAADLMTTTMKKS
jgi:hypothetical protein